MKKRTFLLIILILSNILYSQEIKIEVSVPYDQSDYFQGNQNYLADPIYDLKWSNNGYSEYSSLTHYADSVNLLWFSFASMDDSHYYLDLIKESLIEKLLPRFSLFPDLETGLELNLTPNFWEKIEMDSESWEKWVLALCNILEDSGIGYLELSKIPDRISTKRILFLQENLQSISIELRMGIRSVDFLHKDLDLHWNLQAYDYSGKHSTVAAVEEQLYLLKTMAVPMENISLSIPLYGRNYISDNQDYWFQTMTYKDIISVYRPDIISDSAGPYSFNGIATLQNKVTLCRLYGIKSVKLENIQWDSRQQDYSLLSELLKLKNQELINSSRESQ